jgi:Spy/CpxP family protein refolding chaperone
MKKMLMWAVLCVAGVALAAEPGQGTWQRRPDGPGPGAGGGDRDAMRAQYMQRMADELGLSPEQVQKWESLMSSQRGEMMANFQETQKAREEYEAIMRGSNFNEKAARAALKKVHEVTEKSITMRAKNQAAMNAILTPEQQNKMRERMQQMHERRPGGMEDRGRGEWMKQRDGGSQGGGKSSGSRGFDRGARGERDRRGDAQ